MKKQALVALVIVHINVVALVIVHINVVAPFHF